MKLPFTFLSWGGRWFNAPGFGTVYLNGKPTDLAAVLICTVFGFGFCIFDAQEPDSTPHNLKFKRGSHRGGMRHGIRFGFIRFARDKYEYDLPNAVHIR